VDPATGDLFGFGLVLGPGTPLLNCFQVERRRVI
jgi:hypothetical protein